MVAGPFRAAADTPHYFSLFSWGSTSAGSRGVAGIGFASTFVTRASRSAISELSDPDDSPRSFAGVLVHRGGTVSGAAVARVLRWAGNEVAILGRRPERWPRWPALRAFLWCGTSATPAGVRGR